MDRRQSSAETRCIKILVTIEQKRKSSITLSTQLDTESTIHILEACLKNMKDKTSQNGSIMPIGKEK